MTNTKRLVVAGTGLLLGAALLFGALWFQPWKLWTTTTVDEPIPQPTVVATASATNPTVIAEGALISHEHPTSGTVKLLRLADGSTVVRLENLSTSEGPKLQVVFTEGQRQLPGAGGHRSHGPVEREHLVRPFRRVVRSG